MGLARERRWLKSFLRRKKIRAFLQPHCCWVRKAAPLGRETNRSITALKLALQLEEILPHLREPYLLAVARGSDSWSLGWWLGKAGSPPTPGAAAGRRAASSGTRWGCRAWWELGGSPGRDSAGGMSWHGWPGRPARVTQWGRLAPISEVGKGQQAPQGAAASTSLILTPGQSH